MPFSGDQRRRPRRPSTVALAAVALGLAWLFSLGVAYRAGTTEQVTRVSRLERELELQGQLVRDISRRAAKAEQQLHANNASPAPNQPPTAAPAKEGAAAELDGLIDRRLKEGVSIAQLRTTIAALQRVRHCDTPPETRRFLAGTAVGRDSTTARFAAGRVTVAGSGAASRGASGRPEAWFDIRQPIELQIEVGGAKSTASGVLPLTATVMRGSEEFRFEARPHSKRGYVEVTMTVCQTA